MPIKIDDNATSVATASPNYPADPEFVYDAASQFTEQQQRFIKSDEPYTLLVAGAGTGKTTSITGKLDYLINEQHIVPNSILALSFSNSAAKNLKNKYPTVQTMTFDRFVTNQVAMLWPDMDLTEAPNFDNAVATYIHVHRDVLTDAFVAQTHKLLKAINPGGYKPVNYHDMYSSMTKILLDNDMRVLWYNMLNDIQVLTFDLQTTTLLDNADKITLSNDLEYLLVDEAQDTSLQQMRLILKLANTSKAKLAVIGDASQNLYSWRNVSSKTLSVLETSGIFANYKIETNFRSNDYILSYANQFLKVLKTNETAQLQLTTPAPQVMDQAAFKNAVKLQNISYTPYARDKNAGPSTTTGIVGGITSYLNTSNLNQNIQDWLSKGETVAVISRTNKALDAVEDFWNSMTFFDDKNEVLTPLRPPRAKYGSNILTSVLANATSDLNLNQPITGMGAELNKRILAEADKYVTNPKMNWVPDYVKTQFKAVHANNLPVAHNWNQGSLKGYLNALNHALTKIESDKNKTAQLLDGAEQSPLGDAKLALATIHASKGFEFDHVIIINDEHAKKSSNLQEEQRLRYVAVTRAKKSVEVLNFYPYSAMETRVVSADLAEMNKTPYATAYLLALGETFTGLSKTQINDDEINAVSY